MNPIANIKVYVLSYIYIYAYMNLSIEGVRRGTQKIENSRDKQSYAIL